MNAQYVNISDLHILKIHLVRLFLQACRQILWGPLGDGVMTAWPQDCFTPLSLLHKHSEWPSTLRTDVEVKPGPRKEGRKERSVLDWEGSLRGRKRGGGGVEGALSNFERKKMLNSLYQNKYFTDSGSNNEHQFVLQCQGYHLQNLAVGGWGGKCGTL